MTHTAIVGTMHSGKSTLASLLVGRYGYTRMGLADEVKYAAMDMLNEFLHIYRDSFPDRWDGLCGKRIIINIDRQEIEDSKGVFRPFLQWLGTDFARQYLKNDACWIEMFSKKVQAHGMSGPIVCDDVRFPNEADALRELGFRIVRIRRPEEERIASILASGGSLDALTHASESDVSSIRVDEDFDCYSLDDIAFQAARLAGDTNAHAAYWAA